MLLLGIKHRQQASEADCLAACAEVVLNYLGIRKAYIELLRLLETSNEGTFFPNLKRIETFGLFVEINRWGEAELFEHYIGLGLPIIVGVKTLYWEHWDGYVTEHAVIVVGIDRDNDVIYINDPAFSEAPLKMSLVEFEIGWIERDRQYAVIGLEEPS